MTKIYKLSTNENPLGSSPAVVKAIQQYATGLGEYPSPSDETLRQALAAHHGRSLGVEHFVTANSGCEVLDLIARAFLHADTEAIICRPTFPVYALTARTQKAKVVEIDLESTSYSYNVDEILAAVTPKTSVVYICSPNNPTGSMFRPEQLAQLIEALPAQALLVFDEVYYHFITETERADPLAYVLANENILVVHSFSKAYGLAGLRLGYGMGQPALIERLSAFKRPFHLSTLALEAGLAALQDQSHIEQSIDVTVSGRQWLFDQLQKLGLQVWPSQGNFLMFRSRGSAQDWSERLQTYGVLVRPAFGMTDCIRVTVGLPEANERFIEALRLIVND